MINKELMREWIAALRSRKYKQGTGCLRKTGPTSCSVDRFCCLGVICNLIDSDGWGEKPFLEESYNYYLNSTIHDERLPSDYLVKLGLCEIDEFDLITMNDRGNKFHEIADYLQRKYLNEH